MKSASGSDNGCFLIRLNVRMIPYISLLNLLGVNQANRNTLEKWSKQILHVWVQNKETANLVTRAFHRLPGDLISNTVVIISRTRRSDFIFYNP